jgi:hypothetical protein
MSAAAFAYVLVLHGLTIENELMALLSQERRAEVLPALEKAKEMPPAEIRAQLRQLREDHINGRRESVKSRIGLDLDRVSPELQAWLTRPF